MKRIAVLIDGGHLRVQAKKAQKNYDPRLIEQFAQRCHLPGLDIANYSYNKAVDRIVLVTNDTDCVPALKLARISGLQTVLICLPGRKPHSELAAHADYVRKVSWP